jgi:hypothetical protein
MVKVGDTFVAKSLVPGFPDLTVIFKGIQETGFENFPDFAVYDLTEDIPGHPKDSTVSRDTIEENGYILDSKAP